MKRLTMGLRCWREEKELPYFNWHILGKLTMYATTVVSSTSMTC